MGFNEEIPPLDATGLQILREVQPLDKVLSFLGLQMLEQIPILLLLSQIFLMFDLVAQKEFPRTLDPFLNRLDLRADLGFILVWLKSDEQLFPPIRWPMNGSQPLDDLIFDRRRIDTGLRTGAAMLDGGGTKIAPFLSTRSANHAPATHGTAQSS